MARSRIDPTSPIKTEVLSVRLARADYERVRQLARDADRPTTSQCRVLIKTALNLSAPATREDAPS